MATRIIDRAVGAVQTTSTGLSTLMSYAMPENSVAAYEYNIVGIASSGTVAHFREGARVRRSTGNVVIPLTSAGSAGMYTVIEFVEDGLGGLTAVNADSTVSTTNLIVQVSGAANITMDWLGDMTITLTST